ncbi:MAG: YlbF family regulator [Clostridia bacterium]|nr:YlbF family regulator [Clostridia bacterium]
MKTVLTKAQELAEAISASDVYLRMKEMEAGVEQDPEAAAAVRRMMEKRERVEELLTRKGMDPGELKIANAEMILAEREMNTNEKVMALKTARKAFSDMMDNVNRILRVVITGEIREEDVAAPDCSGSCEGCSGCG